MVLCVFAGNVYAVPCYSVAKNVYKIPYEKYTYNCLMKARIYHNYLVSKGVRSRLVIGHHGNSDFYRHAWVEYEKNGKWYLVDLTASPRTWGFKAEYYKEYRPSEYHYKISFIN